MEGLVYKGDLLSVEIADVMNWVLMRYTLEFGCVWGGLVYKGDLLSVEIADVMSWVLMRYTLEFGCVS